MDEPVAESPGGGSGSPEPRLRHRVLKTGESFGNYRIVKCIASGLIVNYYRAQHVRDLREITLGIFHPKTLEDTKFLRRLLDLKQLTEKIRHDGIPAILDCAQVDHLHCIYMEPVEGTTLSDYFKEHTQGQEGRGCKEAETREIIAQILGLLGVAHSYGLDHRDLDSNFVLLQTDGSLRILGLGIRTAVGVNIFEAIVSASVSPLASNKNPQRMSSFDVISPEYQQGLQEDSRADINAVGVLCYWLLTGRKLKRAELIPPSKLAEGISPNWDSFIEKSTTRKLDERYASAKLALLSLKETDVEPTSEEAGTVQRQIDRIPVPKGIRKHGERATTLFRLALIGLVGLTLVGLTSYFYTVTFTDDGGGGYERSVAMQVDDASEADLLLQISPPVAKVEFTGKSGKSFIAADGRLALKVQPGSYRVKISAPNHVPEIIKVEQERGEILELATNLKPAWTDFRIVSEPGASVSVIDEQGQEIELGRIDDTGIFYLQKGIFAGNYDIIIEKEGFQRLVLKNREIVFGEVTQLDAPLVGEPAKVSVRTDPAGAKVILDGVPVGVSPLEIDPVEAGKNHLISVELEGYRVVGRRVQLRAGEEQLVDFGKLVPPSGELRFEVTTDGGKVPVDGAFLDKLAVEIDGVAVPLDSPELKQVLEGRHTVRLLHPEFLSEPLAIEIKDRDVIALPVEMKPRPGIVELVLPEGLSAQVLVEARQVAVESGRVPVPAGRPVELTLLMPNYLTMRRKVELASNEVLTWEVKAVPIPAPSQGMDWTVPYIGIELAWCPPGTFEMGSPLREVGRLPDEGPQTEVRFTYGFWAGVFEITQAQYQRLMDENPSAFPDAKKPVESITWEEARLFCRLLTELEGAVGRLPEGYAYRLPLESEWEYAARAGTKTPFFWGERADPALGNFEGSYPGNSEAAGGSAAHYGTLPVGSFSANGFGLYDIHGNVRELTLDYYNGRHPGGSLTDPTPRRDGLSIAARGGSWKDTATHARIAERAGIRASTRSDSVGFRVVLGPEME